MALSVTVISKKLQNDIRLLKSLRDWEISFPWWLHFVAWDLSSANAFTHNLYSFCLVKMTGQVVFGLCRPVIRISTHQLLCHFDGASNDFCLDKMVGNFLNHGGHKVFTRSSQRYLCALCVSSSVNFVVYLFLSFRCNPGSLQITRANKKKS